MTLETISTKQVAAELLETLRAVGSLGVPWEQTRFASYLSLLEASPDGWRTPTFSSDDERADERLQWEAVGQAVQLTTAAQVWHLLDAELLRAKLRLVVKGSPLPPSGVEDDKARNALLELTTAALLHRQGLGIQLTTHREDMRVDLPGYGVLALECKRPARADSLDRNLGRVRRQLMGRLSDGVRDGIAAIGVERIERANADFLAANDSEHLRRILDRASLRLIGKMRRFGGRDRAFWPSIPVGAAVFCGVVLLRQPPVRVSVSQISMFCTTADPRQSAGVESAFRALMKTIPLRS